MSGCSQILFQLANPRIGCHLTQLVYKIMSEPFWIFFGWSKVGIGSYYIHFECYSVRMAQNIILISKNPNRHLFNWITMPDSVRTIQNNFLIDPNFKSDAIQHPCPIRILSDLLPFGRMVEIATVYIYQPYIHLVEFYRMVQNHYSVAVR